MNLFKNKLNDEFNLQDNLSELRSIYKPMDLEPTHCDSKRQALKKLSFILKHVTLRDLQEADAKELILCSLTLVYYFGMRLKLNKLTSFYSKYYGKRNFSKAESEFQKVIELILPDYCEFVIKVTLVFFGTVDIWPFESFVGQILEVLLYYSHGEIILFNVMLTDIHYVLYVDVKSARHRMRVLYELLQSDQWIVNKQKLLPFITRLLNLFACSFEKDAPKTPLRYLKKGFEVCLRRIFERADNQDRLTIITTMINWFSMVVISDKNVLEFSSLLNYAADLYKVGLYSESIREGLVDQVLNTLVGSPNQLISLIGSRLLLKLMDRQNNWLQLLEPTIYYEFTQANIHIGDYDSGDKSFVRQHREHLHEFILKAIMLHCTNTDNLRALFSLVCCIIVEVPCGLTAAAAACMMMAVQDFALNAENLSASCRYWMHAVVISVMSLICWVHRASVLYRYVNQLISRRAKEAPQLNPPLMQTYSKSHYHITWNRTSLYFEDWELRYGLWKHFQDTRSPIRLRYRNYKTKVPFMDLVK